MKKWIKWGLLFAIMHIVIFSIALYTDRMPAKYEAIILLSTPLIFIYEFPGFIICKMLSISIDGNNIKFIILAYSLGTVLYFSIGALLGYARSLPKKADSKNQDILDKPL